MREFIFTEFLDLVEEKFGLEMVSTIISQSKLGSQEISTNNFLLLYPEYFFSDIGKSCQGIFTYFLLKMKFKWSLRNILTS